MQTGQMVKILLEEQQISFPTLEEPIREEVDAKELVEAKESNLEQWLNWLSIKFNLPTLKLNS